MENTKPIIAKSIISGAIVCATGLHIGASDAELSIGGMDNPVVRDPLTKQPYIPGSSLKGKLRSLLERSLDMEFNKNGGNSISRHECCDPDCPVCRLFGAAGGRGGDNIPSRLHVRDAFLEKESAARLAEIDEGLPYTEWKSENSLDRVTCSAVPRPIERVPAGARFCFEIVYTVENTNHVQEDLSNLEAVMQILEDDALGGGGSRGNGRVRFEIKKAEVRPVSYYLGRQEPKTLVPESGGLGKAVAEAL